MYLSRTGICNLGRGLAVDRVGDEVQDKLAAYPTITSAVVVSAKDQIRFTCLDSAGTAGIILVFEAHGAGQSLKKASFIFHIR